MYLNPDVFFSHCEDLSLCFFVLCLCSVHFLFLTLPLFCFIKYGLFLSVSSCLFTDLLYGRYTNDYDFWIALN